MPALQLAHKPNIPAAWTLARETCVSQLRLTGRRYVASDEHMRTLRTWMRAEQWGACHVLERLRLWLFKDEFMTIITTSVVQLCGVTC